MATPDIIRNNYDQISLLCKTHGVKKLFMFGSVATGTFNPSSSDIDLIVDIDESDPIKKGEFIIDLWIKLEDMFKIKVDLLTDNSIKNPVLRKSIEKTKTIVYERPN